MVKVLFVCLGNICRSPTAEGIFRDLVQREGLSKRIRTDSCGTSGWHIGAPADDRARAEAKNRGIDIDDLRGRKTVVSDFTDFDYILAMDARNRRDLLAMAPPGTEDRVHMMLSFAPNVALREVPDPYYGGPDGFSDVFDMLSEAANGLLADIKAKHIDHA